MIELVHNFFSTSTNKHISYYIISAKKLYGFYPECLFKENHNNIPSINVSMVVTVMLVHTQVIVQHNIHVLNTIYIALIYYYFIIIV